MQLIFGIGERKHNPVIEQIVNDLGLEVEVDFNQVIESEIARAAERIIKHKRVEEILKEVILDGSDVSLVNERVQRIKEKFKKQGSNF
jgi:uncharacterized protein (DUF2267 family)